MRITLFGIKPSTHCLIFTQYRYAVTPNMQPCMPYTSFGYVTIKLVNPGLTLTYV